MTQTATRIITITERIDAVTGIPERYRTDRLPAPRSVKIELTSQCNYRCGFCAHRLRMKDRGEMDRGFYERVVGEMVDAGVEELGLFYIGESFMCDWLPDAIRYAKDRGIKYAFLTTNGSLAKPERVKACMEAGLDSLKFSMNNADEEQFKEIAAVKPKLWRDAIGYLKAAHGVREEGGYSCRLYASSIRYDGEQQEKMMKLVDDIRPYTTGSPSIRWEASRPSARRSWATGRSRGTRAAWERSASRFPAGPRSPRATSRTRGSSPPAASMRATSG